MAIALSIIAGSLSAVCMPKAGVSTANTLLFLIKTAGPVPFHVTCVATVKSVRESHTAIAVAVSLCAAFPWVAGLVPHSMMFLC